MVPHQCWRREWEAAHALPTHAVAVYDFFFAPDFFGRQPQPQDDLGFVEAFWVLDMNFTSFAERHEHRVHWRPAGFLWGQQFLGAHAVLAAASRHDSLSQFPGG